MFNPCLMFNCFATDLITFTQTHESQNLKKKKESL